MNIFNFLSILFGVIAIKITIIDCSTLIHSIRELNNISNDELNKCVKFGIESVQHERNLERNLINAQITVQNGSISHQQLLQSLSNADINYYNEIALKILNSAVYVNDLKCIPFHISGMECQKFLSKKSIPTENELFESCKDISENHTVYQHSFRRLLTRHYRDGFYQMFTEDHIPSPRDISEHFINMESISEHDVQTKNLAFVFWAQFVEHDLSMPVFRTMSDAVPIDCCDSTNSKLLPRYRHPACIPLYKSEGKGYFSSESCLSYVRSALSPTKCTFGSFEQANQATSELDLSQIYGFTEADEKRMRTYENGLLKSSYFDNKDIKFLPVTSENIVHKFCPFNQMKNNTICFMSGDSRVNMNEYSILFHTIFLRNHNLMASKLKEKYPDWNDEKLYKSAKEMNIYIYRRITLDEWLPKVIGNITELQRRNYKKMQNTNDDRISNEFAIAAMHFYYSMIPMYKKKHLFNSTNISITNNFSQYLTTDEDIIQILPETVSKLLLHHAIKMDGKYEKGWISQYANPTYVDVLAFDIQRGRDHGLQPYVKYLEICNNIQIKNWNDLKTFIDSEDVENLKTIYKDWSKIDLIIGGISEIPINNSTVGPTFTCILYEQFSKIKSRHEIELQDYNTSELINFKNINGFDLLCANTKVGYVQRNIFKLPNNNNDAVACSNH